MNSYMISHEHMKDKITFGFAIRYNPTPHVQNHPQVCENSPFGREKSLGSTLPHLTQPNFRKTTIHLISLQITPTQKITP